MFFFIPKEKQYLVGSTAVSGVFAIRYVWRRGGGYTSYVYVGLLWRVQYTMEWGVLINRTSAVTMTN